MNYVVTDYTNSLIIPYNTELKNHLKISDDSEKTLIESYIRAAGVYIEKYVGYPILSSEIKVIDRAMNYKIDLPKTISEVKKIEIFDNNVWTEVDYTTVITDYGTFKKLYSKDLKEGFEYMVTCDNEPCINDVHVQAAKLLVAEMYENKENKHVNTATMRPSVNVLLDLVTIVK